MNEQVILVKQGEKYQKCEYDIIYYNLVKDKLCLFSDYFDQELQIDTLLNYPKIKVNTIEDQEHIFRILCKNNHYTIEKSEKSLYLKNIKKFYKISITNEFNGNNIKLYISDLSNYDIIKSFGETDTYEFSVPNQYYYNFVSSFKIQSNCTVLDYIGIHDSVIHKISETSIKFLISEDEKKYYIPIEEIVDGNKIDDYCTEPLKMSNEYKIESLLKYGNIITKTLIQWFYHSKCYDNIINADIYTKIKLYLDTDEALKYEYPDKNYKFDEGIRFVSKNLVIQKQMSKKGYQIYVWNNSKTVKFEMNSDIPLFYLNVGEKIFYLFEKLVLCNSENKWMFFKEPEVLNESNLNYFFSTSFKDGLVTYTDFPKTTVVPFKQPIQL